MLSLHSARQRARTTGRPPRIGLAIAGGGPIGGMYELGALRALDEAIDGLDLTRLDGYVGVSSGAFLAAGLANRIDTAEMCRIFITGDSADVQFRPETFLRPAIFEYLRSAARLPKLAATWWQELLFSRNEARWSDLLMHFGALVPTGLFDNSQVERFLQDVFSRRGRSNDFRDLDANLCVVAVDLDSGEAVKFGTPGWDGVPISVAVQASAALPGLYPPVEIGGRHFVDGALRRTMHASVLLDRDVDLMIGLNPLVPFTQDDGGRPVSHERSLAAAGLPAVLSQTFRTLLQSRMQVGLARYAQQYPNIDQLIFEPNAGDAELFFTNAFSFSARRRICEIAWRNTMADLRRRADELAPVLGAHGLALRMEVVSDEGRSLLDGLAPPPRDNDATARLRRALDDIERERPPARRAPRARRPAT
ncbi:patatin-like phospholipase family protein [Lysobacter auxotrophicus]|uniref:Patatin-like phospholipase family protein n=1 Tax=Lysobacter auxotrophicus TaxID=2992573 RepID=A0ABN6UKZ6_9GAMM|nr:patatin-like phospholipase family protein [Lysobacter auxotrophicus]BDU16940.1 patatin-like phospholipase family protein [Lysobacter auxotrophicus]